jgi:hypothetical protein
VSAASRRPAEPSIDVVDAQLSRKIPAPLEISDPTANQVVAVLSAPFREYGWSRSAKSDPKDEFDFRC